MQRVTNEGRVRDLTHAETVCVSDMFSGQIKCFIKSEGGERVAKALLPAGRPQDRVPQD